MPKADSPITPDPVFAAIETAMQKHDAFRAALDAVGDFSNGNPQALAADALAGQCCGEDFDAMETVAGCKPTTLAGVAAAARFFAAHVEREGVNSREIMEALLGNMATALERIEAGRLS